MKILKDKRGFTLVETLIVVTIIGILAVVSVPNLVRKIDKAKITRLITDYDTFRKATLSNLKLDDIKLDDDLKEDIKNDINTVPLNTPIGGQYELDSIQGGFHPNKEGDGLDKGETSAYWRAALAIKKSESSDIDITNSQFKILVEKLGNTNIIIKNNEIYLKIVD